MTALTTREFEIFCADHKLTRFTISSEDNPDMFPVGAIGLITITADTLFASSTPNIISIQTPDTCQFRLDGVKGIIIEDLIKGVAVCKVICTNYTPNRPDVSFTIFASQGGE